MLAEVLERKLREIQAIDAPKVAPKIPQAVIFAPPVVTGPQAPSAKQIQYFQALVEGKQMTDAQRDGLKLEFPLLTKTTICHRIGQLVALPWTPRPVKTATPAPTFKLADGYYAVVDPLDSVLRFFQIRSPKRGKWVGFHFLSQVSGDNKFSVRDRAERDRIYAEIEKDPTEALKRFGKEIGQCGHCRKQLTDAESREFGIGPVCRKMLGL